MVTRPQNKPNLRSIAKQQHFQSVAKILFVLVVVIMTLLPFHGFLTTWLGSQTGGLLVWRAWKELLLVGATLMATYLLVVDSSLRQTIFNKNNKVVWAMLVFVLWQAVRAVTGGEDIDSLLLGLAIQVRMFVFFGCSAIATYYMRPQKKLIIKIVLWPAALVALFGVLQMTVLPHDFLSHFGYEKGVTIPPFFTIDEQIEHIRIASTLRGPNPLGVYLIMPIIFLIACWRKIGITWRQKIAWGAVMCAFLVCLYGSHSRGAWLGLAATCGVWLLLVLPRTWRNRMVVSGLIIIPIIAAVGYQARDTSFVRNVILHDNPDGGGEVSSNQGHLESLQSGIENVIEDPLLGCGVGCAGPASIHNENGVQLSENYFIQTAEESGLVGLLLLMIIFVLIAQYLMRHSNEPIAAALLAAFVGVSVAALTAHAWADDTIAYLWWGVAAIYMYNEGTGIKNGKTKANKKAQKSLSV